MDDTPVEIAAIESVGPDAIALQFATPEGFSARPGQFLKLTMTVDDEPVSRFYTLSSAAVTETFEMTISIDPDGELTPQLEALEPGDEVILSGPYGNAYYEDENAVLLLAGGPGIGPAVGIAERTLEDGGEATIVYRDSDPLHEKRLSALAERGASVTVIADEQSLDEAIPSESVTDAQVFVYGFADFLDEAMSAITAAGGEPDRAKVENFG